MKVSMEAALAELHAGPDAFTPDCPTRELLDHVTSRWGVLILVALSSGTMRWGELHRWARGISEKMLAQTLRTLEADGLVRRDQHPVVPPHVDYSLTDRGRELSALLLPLMNWIIAYAPPQPAAAPTTTLDAKLSGQAQLPRLSAGTTRCRNDSLANGSGFQSCGLGSLSTS
jgi:DNA-binding HxlR family transcriptional regulator